MTLSAYQSAIVGVQMQAAWQEVFSSLQNFKVKNADFTFFFISRWIITLAFQQPAANVEWNRHSVVGVLTGLRKDGTRFESQHVPTYYLFSKCPETLLGHTVYCSIDNGQFNPGKNGSGVMLSTTMYSVPKLRTSL